jgi:hypothetical protein
MKPINTILRNISVLNLLLLAVALFLFFAFAYPMINKKIKVTIPKTKDSIVQSVEKIVAESGLSYSDFASVAEKNLFHPERIISSTDKKDDQPIAKPEVILYGTLITGEKKVAYVEDKKSPYSTPGRGKRQIALPEGGTIGGYTLKEVRAESIMLVRGDDKMIVNLSDQKDRKPVEGTSRTATTQSQYPSAMQPSRQLTTDRPAGTPPPLPLPPQPMPARPALNR